MQVDRSSGGSVASAGDGIASAGDNGAAAAGSGSGGDDASGDEDSADSAGSAPGETVGGTNVLIDTSRVAAGQQQIDTPVTSGGNSSLWFGEDGLAETPGGDR